MSCEYGNWPPCEACEEVDTKELRRLAQAATPGPWYVGSGIYEGRNIYSVVSVTDAEGFTYQPVVATVEDNDTQLWSENTSFIAAANPAAINELLSRLEAAESECLEQARLNGMGSEREAALMAKLEAAEKDIAVKEEVIDSLAAVVKRLDAQCDAAGRESDECNRRQLEAADHFAAQTALMKKKYDDLRAALRHEADCVDAAKAEIELLRAANNRLGNERDQLSAEIAIRSIYGNRAAPSVPTIEAAEAMGAMGGPAVEAERLAFEAWVRGHNWSLCARWNGEGYVGDLEQGGAVCPHAMRARMMWAAWRDRAALAHLPMLD